MILILSLWLIVVGYTLVYLGLDKLSNNPKNLGFFQVFFPQFLGAKVTSDGGTGVPIIGSTVGAAGSALGGGAAIIGSTVGAVGGAARGVGSASGGSVTP